jgi:hypothetical protein
VWGGRDLSAAVAAALERWQRGIGMGRDFVDYLLLPYRVSFEAGPSYPRFDGQLTPWALPLFALGLLWFRRWRLLAFGGVLFVAWAFIGSQQLRFLTPFFGVAAVVNAGVLSRAIEWTGGAARRALRTVVMVLVGVFTLTANAGFVAAGLDGWQYIMYRDYDALVTTRVPPYAAYKYIDENSPPDAVILMLFENRLLYLNRRAVYDSFFEASETLYHVGALHTPEEVAAYVRGTGATHILTSLPFAEYSWHYYEPSCRALWEMYLERYTTVLAVVNGFEVRGITPAAGAATAP